jgi:hypothetical protein
MVELNYVDEISHETVRKVLKKTNLSLGGSRGWVIPPSKTVILLQPWSRFLMFTNDRIIRANPVVCMDESPKQLIKET